MIPVVKNIPPPKGADNPPSPQTTDLPWDSMECGDSFLVPFEGVDPHLLMTRLNGLKSYQKSQHPGVNFRIRTLPEGCRVWRSK